MTKREFLKCSICGLAGISILSSKSIAKNLPIIKAQASSYDGPSKFSKQSYFATETPRGMMCQLCPNECVIKTGDMGDCNNRKNYDGKLYSIAYGNPCAVHVDPIEKKPLYHFYPGSQAYSIATAGCNLACLNCQNWTISQVSPDETVNEDLMPEKVVSQCQTMKCKSIAYTYSEPITFYEYTFDTATIAKEKGIKNVLVSAGYINEKPLRKLCSVIDAANIDLKSFSNDIYIKLNGGTLEPVKNTLKIMAEEGVWLEITNLVVPSWTDDMDMIKRMCAWLVESGLDKYPLHFSRFHPMYKLTQLPSTPAATLEQARKIALAEGIKYVYIGNVPGADASNTICPKCKQIVVERKGYKINLANLQDGKCKFCGTAITGVWK
ncbi:MAG: AmmeMemoRadiSam system radical SAM enzyme [Bacteroidales bacterium]|nr:AmmeMemoRadiSam system radical SAM enzyme [Bacteroidales bacterium]